VNNKSFANGNGSTLSNGPDMQPGSPVPRCFRDWEWLTARGITTTSWEFQ
jgi:hypothetical protein